MLTSGTEDLSLDQYKSKLKCHAKAYRKKVIIDSIKIREHYYNDSIPKDKKILGCYRHFNYYVNYDYLVEKIIIKWEKTNQVFSRDLIHSLSNKCNDLILEAILEGPLLPHEK